MPVKFGSILHLNNSGSEATLDANNLKGTALQIDDFNSASLAKIGTGLTTAPGKRRLGTIVANTGSINDPVRYYAFINSGSGDVNLSGSEWTTLTNWAQLILDNNTSSFTSTATDGDISGAIDAATGSILNDYGLLSSSIQIADAISGSFLLNTTDEFTGLLTLTGDLSASGNISGSSLHITTTESIKNIIRSDGGWRFVSTLGTSDEDVQYLDATNNLLQWRSNGDAKFQIKSQNSGVDQAYVHFNHVSGDELIRNFSIGTSQDDGSFIISKASDLSSNKIFVITGSNGFIGINNPNPTERLSVSGSISASGDVSATNVSASILRISDPEHTGQLTFSQDSDNSYRLISNIGTIFDFGSTNVITTSQRIDGTRGMQIKTFLDEDPIRFRDFDDNNIILVNHSGSLTLGNASGHEPYVTINTDVTASGNISASNTVFANRVEIGQPDSRTSTTRLVINKDSNARAIIEFPASSSTTENDPGFIRHTELSQDNGRMEFCVSDQNGSNDTFAFGHASGGNPNNELRAAVTFTARGLVRTSGSIQAGSLGNTADANITSTGFISSNTNITASNNIKAGGNISASGHLFASLSLDNSNHKTVMYDTASGQLFFTGSYGGGGGGSTFTGFNLSGDSGFNQTITSGNTVEIAGGTNINTIAGSTDTVTVNLDSSIFLTGDGLFSSGSSLLWGASTLDATSGFRRDSGRAYTHVTPQFVKSKYAIIGALVRQKNVLAQFPDNYLVYGPSGIFVNGGRDPDTDGPVRPDVAGGKDHIGIPVVQVVGDLEVRPTQSLEGGGNTPGIRIAAGDPSGSVDPGIFFYSRDNISNDSSSFFYSSASAEIRFDTGSNSIKFLAGSTTENLTEVLHISKSGANPRIGIGTSNPIKAFDFKEIRDDNRGGELLIRGSRTAIKGAENNDEVGRINFAIDSASFGKIDTSGSAAEIVAIVDDVDATGVEGSLSLRVAGPTKVDSPIQRIKLIGNPNSPAVEITGSTEFDTDVTVKNNLFVNDYALINGLRVGSSDTDPGAGRLITEDYGVFVGGVCVGSFEDPGSQNLLVQGGTTTKGNVQLSGSNFTLPTLTTQATVESANTVLILDDGTVKQAAQTSMPYTRIADGVIPTDKTLLMFTGSSGTKEVAIADNITYNAALGWSFQNAGSLSSLFADKFFAGPSTITNITSSGNISSSGTIKAATLDAAAVSDTLAAAIVAEIDNDEIPIAKLAEDAITIGGAGAITLGNSATVANILKGSTAISSSAQIASDISGSLVAASASLAADIVTNAGNIGTTTNALTVDDATLQLNSGTTFNGSAARTISIKDGGVDSDALASNISITSVTASRFRGDGRDLTNIPNDLVWDGTVGDGRLTIITCQRFLETGFQTEIQNINTSSLEYTDTGLGVAITSPVIYARDHDDAEITNNIGLASTPYIVFSGSNFQMNATLEAASGNLLAKIDLNELDHDNDGVITDTKLLKSIKDKLLELRNNSTFNPSALNYNIQDSFLVTSNTGAPHQIALSNFDAASPDNTNVFSFHYFTSESSRRGGGAETTQIFNVTTNPNKVYSSLITDLDTTFSSSLEITGSLTLADGTLAIPGFANVSSSLASVVAGNIGGGIVSGAAQIDSLINDTIAATIVAEIDNDEIPIAKLAEDAVTVTAGTGLSGGGSVTLGSSITINSNGLLSSSAQIASNISGSFTAASASFSTRVTANDAKLTANTSNVTSAGALMDSEVTNLSFVKGLTGGISDGNVLTANNAVSDDDFLRINGTEVEGLTAAEVRTALNVENGADVTDTSNVTSAGALMDSELSEIATVKALTAAGISGSFTAASASLAADIVTNAGNIGTTTNALTVDNATLQLNSGTTFNGSAARTISIKDGGVDSDALAANISVTQITASAAEITTNKLSKTSNTDADHQGDVVFFGGTTSMTAGRIYHYNSSGNWELSNATDNTKSTGLLAVALGTASDTDGMLLKGMVTLDHDPGAVGDKLFLRTADGLANAIVASSTGNVIRVIGYCLDASNGQIYFNPSNDHIVHA